MTRCEYACECGCRQRCRLDDGHDYGHRYHGTHAYWNTTLHGRIRWAAAQGAAIKLSPAEVLEVARVLP